MASALYTFYDKELKSYIDLEYEYCYLTPSIISEYAKLSDEEVFKLMKVKANRNGVPYRLYIENNRSAYLVRKKLYKNEHVVKLFTTKKNPFDTMRNRYYEYLFFDDNVEIQKKRYVLENIKTKSDKIKEQVQKAIFLRKLKGSSNCM